MKKIFSALAAVFVFAAALTATAYAQELAVGGQAVGIDVELGGVLIEGVSTVETADGKKSPAEAAGLCKGDFIIKVGERRISSTSDFVDAIAACGGSSLNFTVIRGEKESTFKVSPVKNLDGQWAVGIWLRDGISGIGTLTFFDPETGIYGALGHCISSGESGEPMSIDSGCISDAEIVSVTPGAEGTPGALNGCTDAENRLGEVEQNCKYGIYGKALRSLGGRAYETGQISTGRAEIISTVEGHDTKSYAVEINRIYNEPDGCHVMLTVTDPELCALTGGIVQGMSGSPIIQNGKLVGAVTHVFVSDPKRGYGIGIEDMLTAAGINSAA